MINLMDYDILTKNDFESMAYGGAIIVKNFDPTTFTPPAEGDVALCTSGAVNINDNVNLLDLGDDVNGIYYQYMELQVVTKKNPVTITCTGLNFRPSDLKRYLGAADIDSNNSNKVTSRMFLKSEDFENIALIVPINGGGYYAAVIPHGLSTGGLAITTSKDAKATTSVTITAFRSIEAKTVPEIEYYSFLASPSSDIVITKHPESVECETGDDPTFTVTATGVTSYQWQVMTPTDSTFSNISGKTTYTLALSDVTTDANGNRYRCKLSDGTNTVFTKTALLTVSDNA